MIGKSRPAKAQATTSPLGLEKHRTERFDRAIKELNAFLLVLAIGLAVLDATCFLAFKVQDALPSASVIHASSSANLAIPKGPSLAALTPSRPTGW